MSAKTAGTEFKPNEFYERLIVLRETNAHAFARLSSATLAALQAYEAAKLQAEQMKKGGKK